MKTKLLFLAKVAVSAVLIYVIFTRVPIVAIASLFRSINISYFIAGVFLVVCSLVANTQKWKVLLHHIGTEERLWDLIKLNLIGTLYAFLPGGALTGEVVKGYRITKGRDGKTKIIFSQVMDRLTSFVVFILLGYAGFLFARPAIAISAGVASAFTILLVGAVLFLFLFLSKHPISWLRALHLYWTPLDIQGTFQVFAGGVIDSIFAYNKAYRTLAGVFFYAMLFQLLNTAGIFFFALSLGFHIGYINLLWINALVNVILVVPITIMGLGLREGSFLYFLSAFAIHGAQAVSLSLSLFIVALILGVAGGCIDLYELSTASK